MGISRWVKMLFLKRKIKKQIKKELENIRFVDGGWIVPQQIPMEEFRIFIQQDVGEKTKKKSKRSKRRNYTTNVDKYLDTCCYLDKSIVISARDLYDDYLSWCEKNNLRHCRRITSFGESLKRYTRDSGIQAFEKDGKTYYQGISTDSNFIKVKELFE